MNMTTGENMFISKINVLADIHKSFNLFNRDFEQKDEGTTIYYAMDNDVFSFALYPFDNLKYANLFQEKETQDILRNRAMQMAYAIRYLSERDSLYILPSHKLEYKKTIFSIFTRLLDLKNTINIENLKNEREKIKSKMSKLAVLYGSNSDKFMEEISKVAPLLFKLLNEINEYNFTTQQLYYLLSNDKTKLRHMEEISDNSIEYKEFMPELPFDYEYIIKKGSYNPKSELSLYDDKRAFEYILGFNSEYDDKKLILLTGDKGMDAAYQKASSKHLFLEEEGLIRHPMYLIPFVANAKIHLYDKYNKDMIEEIDKLFERFFNSVDSFDSLTNLDELEKQSEKVIEDLKKILSTKYIKNIDSSAIDKKLAVLKFLTEDDFKDSITKHYDELILNFKKMLSLKSAIVEMLQNRSKLREIKFFYRYPFVIDLKDDSQQQLVREFIYAIIHQNIGYSLVSKINELPLYTIQLLVATAMLHMNMTEKAKDYITIAKNELKNILTSNKEAYTYMYSEIELFELFVNRKTCDTKDEYENTLELFNNYLDNRNLDNNQKFRAGVGMCSLKICYLYHIYFDGGINITSEISTLLKEIIQQSEDYKKFFKNRNQVRKRVKIQIYMNIANLYLLEKYFLKSDPSIGKIFFQENRKLYEELFNDKKIGLRTTILSVLFWDLSSEDNKNYKAIEAIDTLEQVYEYNECLKDYEKKRIQKFIEILG